MLDSVRPVRDERSLHATGVKPGFRAREWPTVVGSDKDQRVLQNVLALQLRDYAVFDRSTGQRRWERRIGGELRQAPVLVNGRVLVAPTLGPVVSYR
jgi:hypothetical protein